MKNKFLLVWLVTFTLIIASCKKEQLKDPELVCGTVFNLPLWAKKFKADSLYAFKTIPSVLFSKMSPGLAACDTTYNTSVQIKFLPNGTGELNDSVSFQYKVNLTESYPQLILYNIQNFSLIFPFPNSFLNTSSIEMTIEMYANTGCQLSFSNGVSPYSPTDVYESSYLIMSR